MMPQLFLLGSSNVYGVGGENGGWADMVKLALHKKMYGKNGVGEKYEVFNFGKSGETIEFVIRTFPPLLKEYGRGGKVITVVSVGGNNAKATGTPDNYVSTIEEYSKSMTTLLDLLKKLSSHVIVVETGFYDEAKTSPKYNPDIGGNSYFSNQRKQAFELKLKEICKEKNITFVELGVSIDEWKEKYLSNDGLHPGPAGYKLISEKVLNEIEKFL